MKNIILPIIAGIAILFFFSCQNTDKVKLKFAFGSDEGNTVQPLIEKFNKENRGKIKIVLENMSPISNEYFEELTADLSSEKPTLHLFGADVVWTLSLATKGLVREITSEFYQTYNPRDFIGAALNSASYHFGIWGVPWFTDAGMLFYRKDLLEKYGIQRPPETWDELKEISKTICEKEGVPYGFVYQGDAYEGGVANACEFMWNAGGQLMIGDLSLEGDLTERIDPNIILIDNKQSEEGFTVARSLITEGISPQEVHTFREAESGALFRDGKSVFLRAWPGFYGSLLDPEAIVKPDQVAVTTIPVTRNELPSFSCLGGWNLMIASHVSDSEKDAALEFIAFMLEEEQQQYRAKKGGILPVWKKMYSDEDLVKEAPVMDLAREVMNNTRVRPVSPYYLDFSKEIGKGFNDVLQGKKSPYETVSYLQTSMEEIMASN